MAVVVMVIAGCARSPLRVPFDELEAGAPARPGGAGAAGGGGGAGTPAVFRDCGVNEYVEVTASDRSCLPVTPCAEWQYEAAAPTPVSDRQCADQTHCGAGEYVARPPTATSDRVCDVCPTGTFNDQLDAPACTTWTVCPEIGWATPGTETHDRSCECLSGSAAVVEGDVVAESQAEVDALAGVREIRGRLWIAGLARTPQGPVIADTFSLDALSCLEVVRGDLTLSDHRNLSELSGLARLTRVDSLNVEENSVLSSIDGLRGLTFTNSVSLTDNDALTSLEPLDHLTILRDHLIVSGNDGLTNLVGLHNIESVGRLDIDANGALTSLSALSALDEVRGSLWISGTALTNLNGLEGIGEVGGSLTIFSNASLTTLAGLENITRVGIGVNIGYNPLLEHLGGLERLERIGEAGGSESRLAIYVNETLASITALGNLQILVGELRIYGNAALSRCQAEALATQLGTTCMTTIDPWTCSDLCTCGGNLNEVVCP